MPPYIKYSKLIKVVFFICFALINSVEIKADTNITPLFNYYDEYLSDYEHIYDGKVKKINSAKSITMDDGKEYKLTYIYVEENIADKVISELNSLTYDKNITLHKFREAKKDRYGRFPVVATVFDNDNKVVSLQEILISKKLAGLYIEDNAIDLVNYLKNIEKDIGVIPINHSEAHKYIGEYKLVKGRIIAGKETKKSIYLNFDNDWREDFTIRIDKSYWQNVKDGYYVGEIDEFVGKNIQIRGFVESYYGPMINLDLVSQMDIIAE